jgi:TolB protein
VRKALATIVLLSLLFAGCGSGGGSQRSQVPATGSPAWSPDGRRIAFALQADPGSWQIYVIDANGRNQRQLTSTGRQDSPSFSPQAWSPAGRWIAFSRPDGIFVIRADGSGLRQLTRNRSRPGLSLGDSDPAWSPDGRKIAFVRQRPRKPFRIFVMNADGSDQHRLIRMATGGFSDVGPTWSPDGRKIAFADFEPRIVVVNANGTRPHKVTRAPLDEAHYAPDWSPDGKKIAFTRLLMDGGSEIDVIKVGGSGHRHLTTYVFARDDDDAAWSRDGRRIAFDRTIEANGDTPHLYMMNADGTHQHALTHP